MNSISFSTFSGFTAIVIVCGFVLGFLIRLLSGTGTSKSSAARFASPFRTRIAHKHT